MQPSTSTSAAPEDSAKRLAEVNACDLLGDRMVDPALFYQGHKQRTGFFVGSHSMLLQSIAIGVTADRGVGGDNDVRSGCG